MRELVIDSFAGGGGASEGIKAALGRDPDIAANHDRYATAMHRINHPGTRHLIEDVVTIDARKMCNGEPVGMLWMSPDCTDHSKAKGAAPKRGEKTTRGLGWACFGWVKALPKWQRPRIVFLENVEEFEDWGPMLDSGKRCPVQKGAIFREFVRSWQALGYVVEWRRRRAWQCGMGTIRKRLYMIMRRDGEPIVWPEPTHGNPNLAEDAALIAAGQLKPWVTAADSIDFSLPCPSIFDASAEIMRALGLRAKRPLADNTMARIAKGVVRYVLRNPKPFIVKVNHTCRGEPRARDIDDPIWTQTGKRDDAVVTPFVTKFNRGATGHSMGEPLHTITAHASETHGGGASPLGIVSPILVGCGGRAGQSEPRGAAEPILTQTSKADLCVATPFLVPRYGERPGQDPRTRAVDVPLPVIVPDGNEGSLAAVHMMRQFGGSIGSSADEPVGTVTAGGAGKTALVHLSTMRNSGKPFSAADEPTQTMTAGGANASVVAAFLAQHNYLEPGHDAREPMSTIVGGNATSTQGVVAAHMLNMRGSDRRDAPADEPLRTASAGGNHAATVYAFLAKYFGAGFPSQPVDDPLHTITAKPRHGLVTVAIEGIPHVIVDIGMRMLTPRERFNAQGFRRDYIIEHGLFEDGTVARFTLEQQGYMCGNSVCPGEAEALVRANYQPREVRARRPSADLPLLMAAE